VLVLADADVRALVTPADAIAAATRFFSAPAETRSSSAPVGLALDGGRLATAMSVDRESGRASVDSLASFPSEGTLAVTIVLAADRPEPVALVESAWLAGLAAGATSALGSVHLARRGAATVGLIGCGVHAAAQLACLRSALEVERIVAYARDGERLRRFCAEHDAAPAEHGREAAELDVVVTATTSRDPVLRGDWLRPGSTVCAAGTIAPEARELDNVVLERAAFVCCDSVAAARAAAGDLVEPVERGVLDWLEVHELAEVVRGEIESRQADDDIAVLKIAGLPALRLLLAALAVERAAA
jgi:ornithine cyclodeaminase/alanine dehydrogenase-like protein (mu-crystallin family)